MPIVTTAAITGLLTTLATKGLEKAFETSGEKISEGALAWLKSLFYKNNEPKSSLKTLQDNPENMEAISNATAIINNSIEDNPEFIKYLEEAIHKFSKVENSITNSKNVITGNVNTGGGNFINGDGNQIS
ncbi:hypothetical protein CHU92_00580 [Flavobacterium cyanobacteriorum]|uniref:Uncharacterized protein n=1 Tax=Flavobacterium cyanobacteriorum TaxID=2022802 RepID=A0A256A4P1_9FLAO|nr:hypothetical protein [Flavobacterium cyanobacteriorum]OYQ48673.1 hypothetical protein CHU92_00580 [Flavobacterium cyanobacteriorum]